MKFKKKNFGGDCPKFTMPPVMVGGGFTLIAEQADKYGVKVTYSSLEYVGTVITAELDKDGNITSLNHTMDLNIDAKATYVFTKIEGKGSGRYTLDATFTY